MSSDSISSDVGPLLFFVGVCCASAGFIFERVLHAVVFFLASGVMAVSDGQNSLKRLASMEVMKEGLTGVFETAHGVVQSVGTLVVSLFSSWIFVVAILFVIFVCVSLQNEVADVMTTFVRVYNSDISSSLRAVFLLGMQMAARFVQPLLFIWNAFFYLMKLLLTDVLLPLLVESKELAAGLAGSVAQLARSISMTFVSYVLRLWSDDCSIDRLMNIKQIELKQVPCFTPGMRALDIITPMGDVRLIVMYSVMILKETCKVLTPPFDLIAYPFLDLNFAKGLHNIVNAVLYWLVSMPLITVKRCQVVSTPVPVGTSGEMKAPFPEGHWMRLIMCTPDASPGFNYLIAGVRRWGQLIDNWSNAVWLVLMGALGLDPPTCAPIPLTKSAVLQDTLFQGREVRVVGLTSGAYAITDGESVQYVFFLGQVTQIFSAYAWKNPISLKHGIASIMYDVGDDSIDPNSGQQTMSMMGCRCIDVVDPLGYDFQDGPPSHMEIECSALRYEPTRGGASDAEYQIASPTFIPIAFANPSSALYMRCATTKITVDSARFPLWRLGKYEEGNKASNYDDPYDSEFTGTDGVDGPDEVDAVVWVMPACDADNVDPACQAALLSAGCMPYCLAARKRGSRNDGLTLYNEQDWKTNVQLIDHDCSAMIASDTPPAVVEFKQPSSSPFGMSSYSALSHSNTGNTAGQFVFQPSWDSRTQQCLYDPKMTSRVSRGLFVTEGSEIEKFKAILHPGQPFAVAGETALTIVELKDREGYSASGWAIRVDRLFGQQGTGFVSLITVNSELPARRPCIQLDSCVSNDPGDLANGVASIPYSVFADPSRHNPAVMTKWGVVYAYNPSYEMFSQVFRYCKEQSTLLEFAVLSSFGPITLWRVDAFAYDDPGGLRAVRTGSASVLPDAFVGQSAAEDCGRVFNVRVSSMEYLNDQNIAVIVLRASPRSFNPNLNDFDNDLLNDGNTEKLVSYRTYFLNPETMRTRFDRMWEENDALATLGQGLLCPSQRRLPDFGSMTAEVISAGLYVIRMLTEVIFTGPAVFTPGAFLKIREMNRGIKYGHSFLLNQGIGWLDFDPFFQAIRRAHMHFFNSFTKFGSLFDNAPYINQFMNGFALYNQDYTPLVTKNMRTYLGAAKRATDAVDNQITSMVSNIAGKNPIVFTGLAASSGVVNAGQYAARMLKTLFLSMIFPGIDAVADGSGGQKVINGLWQVVYDSHENYKTLILASELRSCGGLQLMMGYTNPFARLAASVCEGGVMFKLGLIETAMAFFVDLPMLGCLCTDSQQGDYRAWAITHCYSSAPAQYKGDVLSLIQGSYSLSELCTASSVKVQNNIRNSMDPFLASSYRSSAIIADVVDYMRFVWDKDAGICRDYAGDGAVTAILPDPVEFWQVCALTTTCRAKCSTSIAVFEGAKKQTGQTIKDVRLVQSQATVQSAFFSDSDIIASRSAAPFEIYDMAEMPDCFVTCGLQDARFKDRCVAILGVEYGVAGLGPLVPTIVVAEYCVPNRLDASVSMSTKWSVANSHEWVFGMTQVHLFHDDPENCVGGGVFCSIAVVKDGSVSLYREDGVEYVLERFSSDRDSNTRLKHISRISPLGGDVLLIYGLGYLNGPDSDLTPRSLCADTRHYTRPDGTMNQWNRYDVSVCNQNVIEGVMLDIPICLKDMSGRCGSMILIPTRSDTPAMRCAFETNADSYQMGQLVERGYCTQFPLSKGALKAAGLYGVVTIPVLGGRSTKTMSVKNSGIVVSTSMSFVSLQLKEAFEEYNVFVASHPEKRSNWLAVMRLDTRAATVTYHGSVSVRVDVTVKRGCRVDDCGGCKSLSIQTLCLSAQQCTVANCIGTTVNLNKPLCSMGKLMGDAMEFFLLQWRGGWSLMSIMLIQVIAVASTGKTSTESTLTAMDEILTSQICLQKDAVFDMAGAITSFLNANIETVDNLVQSGGDFSTLFSPAKIMSVTDHVSSEYREAQRTMVLAAVTRFLGNIGLGAVYPLIVARKMMICQAKDIIGVFDAGARTLLITSPEYEDAYTAAAGKCLTDFEKGNMDSSDKSGLTSVMNNMLAFLGTIPFANYKHVLDAGLSFCQGLVRGLQDMVQVADAKNCKLNDVTIADGGQCACSDKPVKISPWKKMQPGTSVVVEDSMDEHSFWCTGFLQLQTPFGMPVFVFNPYSYEALVQAAQNTDAYLACISSQPSGECLSLEPKAPVVLQSQGANLLSVLTRCNANYHAMQWDSGASMLYKDPELLPPYLKFMKGAIKTAHDRAMRSTETALTACMVQSAQTSKSSDGCLAMYLANPSRGMSRQSYFSYWFLDPLVDGPIDNPQSQKIAACIVFSGPSRPEVVGDDVSLSFRECTDSSLVGDNSMGPCTLRSYIWSSQSRNAIPVGIMHNVVTFGSDEKLDRALEGYRQISKDVLAAIEAAEAAFKAYGVDNLKVGLFSAEGDVLHQAFDCVLMGPYGRADLSPRDLDSVLPALEYFRDSDGGKTREFELPCTGETLKGDTQPPFTCGSDVRRSIIKKFVRGGGQNEGINNQMREAINNETLLLFANAKELFKSWERFGCACPTSSVDEYHPRCCFLTGEGPGSLIGNAMGRIMDGKSGTEKRQILSAFVPPHIKNFHFTTIENNNVAGGLLDLAFEYLETDIWTNINTMTSYGVDHDRYKLSSDQKDYASREGLYQTRDPLTNYGPNDAFDHTTNMSAFEVCMGAVSQVMFTLPVGDFVTGAPTTLASMDAWDATQSLPSGHFSALESWVRRLVEDAAAFSPLYWSHRLKHVASDSLVCDALFDDDEIVAESTSQYQQTGPNPLETNTEESVFFERLAASVIPGTSYGVYASVVEMNELAAPEGVGKHQEIFVNTNRSMWALGEVTRSCFCGWHSTRDSATNKVWCMIPQHICSREYPWSVSVQRICGYQHGMYWNHWYRSEDSRIVGKEMQSLIQSFDRLDCPWNMVDPASWGLVDEESFETSWLLDEYGRTQTNVTSKTLLFEGRGGVRYMNAADVLKRGRDSPIMLFNPAEILSTIAQHSCVAHMTARKESSEMNETISYAAHFRDVLFPAVQGVPQNRGTAFCMRYVIELATLLAMKSVLTEADVQVVRQQQIVVDWTRKCHTQTKLLGFCALRNVFSAKRIKSMSTPPDTSGVEDSSQVPTSGVLENHDACPGIFFSGTMNPTESFVVVGSSCTVVYHSASTASPTVLIIDPCQFYKKCHNQSLPKFEVNVALFIQARKQDRIGVLDMYSFVSTHSRTLSLKWSLPEDPHWSMVQDARDTYARDHENKRYTSESAGLNIEKLWQQYVKPTSTSSSATPWYQKNGPRSSDEKAECGGVSDWWPDGWEHPVGFHVTTPCDADTAEYRTFSNQFEYDASRHTMHYKHTELRDENLMMNHAGASGMCRLNTFAQSMREQNNIRICTRMIKGVPVDYAVPIRVDPEAAYLEGTSGWTDEVCSNSPLDVPWKPTQFSHARSRSSGLLLSWPVDENSASAWPPLSESSMIGLGLRNESHPDSWTDSDGDCGMPPQYTCNPYEPDTSCQRYALGLGGDVTMKCLNSICMVVSTYQDSFDIDTWANDANYVECTDHTHCAPDLIRFPDMTQTKLCSGEGRCVVPVIDIENIYDGGDVDVSLNAETCDEESTEVVDMYGKSPWGRITGLLEAHGLCSYRNWYEYGRVYSKHCTTNTRSGQDVVQDVCTLGENVHWTDTSRLESDIGLSIFESRNILYQEAHTCDRSFHHYANHVMCRPKVSDSAASIYRSAVSEVPPHLIRYSSLYETYYMDSASDTNKHSVKIAHVEYMSNPATGFLGGSENFNDLGMTPCIDIPQCSSQLYTIQGHTIPERKIYRLEVESSYRVSDAVFCGAFGRLGLGDFGSEKKCVVDFSVASLAYIVLSQTSTISTFCEFNTGYDAASLATKLVNLKNNGYYPHDRGTVQILLSSIMSGAFRTNFDTIDEYEKRMSCAQFIDFNLRNAPFPTSYKYTIEDAEGTEMILDGSSTLYYFTEYALVEVAPMWWIKCHLLSGIPLSDTVLVECPAWSRSLENKIREGSDYQHDVTPSITVKQWLQQSARKFFNLPALLFSAENRVRTDGIAAMNLVHGMLSNNLISGLEPTCSMQRVFRSSVVCNTSASFQDMMFMTYTTKQSAFLRDYVKLHGLESCCSSVEDCTPSVNNDTPFTSTTPKSLHQVAKTWLFQMNSFGKLIQRLSDPEFMNAIVPQWGNATMAIFSQPWLKTGRSGSDLEVDLSLSRAIEAAFPGVSDDDCSIWSFRNELFASPRGSCIYQGANKIKDPITMANGPVNVDADVAAKVFMFHGTSDLLEQNKVESINVCVFRNQNNVRERKRAKSKNQRCFISDANVIPSTDDDFVCVGSDSLLGCAGAGSSLKNPAPRRQCYETGNDCFNSLQSDEFVKKEAYHWKQARLPVGVRLITYGYPDDPDMIIGRNPKYIGPYEKIFWNNTFFDNIAVASRVADLNLKNPNTRVFARPFLTSVDEWTYPKTGRGTGRRLLEFNETSEEIQVVASRYVANENTSPASRRLLGRADEWGDNEQFWIPPKEASATWFNDWGCKAGWISSSDADRHKYAYGTDQMGAEDSAEEGCVKCAEGEIESWRWWEIQVGLLFFYVNACVPCTGKFNVADWDDLTCTATLAGDGIGLDNTGVRLPDDPPLKCMFDNPQWPPLMSWLEKEGKPRPAGSTESCKFCEENPCTYYRSLPSYKDNNPSPPWYNCGEPPRNGNMARNATETKWTPPSSILKKVSEIQSTRPYFDKSAATSYFVQNWETYKSDFMDYRNGPLYTGKQVNAGSTSGSILVELPARYTSFSLELMPGFFCADSLPTINNCDGNSYQVGAGYYYCSDCTRSAPNREYCRGRHDCKVKNITKPRFDFSAPHCETWQNARISILRDLIVSNSTSAYNVAELLIHLTMAQYRKEALDGRPITDEDTFNLESPTSALFEEPNAQALHHPENWDFPVYSPRRALDWTERTGKKETDPVTGKQIINIKACQELSAETAQVAYQQCSRNQQLLALKQRANLAYNKTGALIVPQGMSVAIPLAASHLLSSSGGVLLSWANSRRDRREKHFEFLMDFESQCATTDIWDSVCRIRPQDGTIELFNPWTGGGFSERSGCDISPGESRNGGADVIDTACHNAEECATQDTSPFYLNQGTDCRSQNGAWAPTRFVRPSARSNICFLTLPTPQATCVHTQGVLGGRSDSRPVGVPQQSLYEYAQRPPQDPSDSGGIFVHPRREIFTSLKFLANDVGIDKSFLHINKFDIGGQQMYFVVSRDGVLHLYDIVLSGGTGPTAASVALRKQQTIKTKYLRKQRVGRDGAALRDWMQWDVESEHQNALRQEPEIKTNTPHWGCPFKQRLYLSGQAGPHFRPSLPNQRRAGTMFSKHSTGGIKYSSTVQESGMASAFVNASSLKTSTGFCFCESLSDCQQPIQSELTCGFRHTVETLGISEVSKWYKSKVLRGQSSAVCTKQLDWPYSGGKLRDGSYINGRDNGVYEAQSPPAGVDCNLLDRIHEFEYRYAKSSVSETADVPRNSAIHGGDCFTSKARNAHPPNGPQSRAKYAWRPAERRSCASQTCAAPPKFTAGPNRVEIPSETSFGVLYRESSERAIAGNLRERLHTSLCQPGSKECELLDRFTNMSSWVPATFWDSFLSDVDSLFLARNDSQNLSSSTNSSNTTNSSAPIKSMSAKQLLTDASNEYELTVPLAEITMWQTPWVFCVNEPPVCVLECEDNNECKTVCRESTNRTCTGAVNRDDWLNPQTRIAQCKAQLLNSGGNSDTFKAVAPINICDMGRATNALCVALQVARSRIFEANCRASGVCPEEDFFYVPGIYSAANQEFVRSTVESFYLGVNNESCPVRLRTNNPAPTVTNANCAAMQLQDLYKLFHNLRTIVDLMMRIGYFGAMIVLNLLRYLFMGGMDAMTGGAEADEAWNQILMYFTLLIEALATMYQVMGDLVWELIMDSAQGEQFQKTLRYLCDIAQLIYDKIWMEWLCPAFLKYGIFFRDWTIIGLRPFENIGLWLLQVHTDNCLVRLRICDGVGRYERPEQPKGLPVATRCWSTYVTFLGDPMSLSCSAADTCMASDFSDLKAPKKAFEIVAGMRPCDRCETPISPSFSRYGCDIITKTCKCNVQTLLRTTCITNDECRHPGTSCDIIDNFFERDLFGTIACNECATDRICLVVPGDSIGHCGCATTPIQYATCAKEAHGLLVSSSDYSMCMVTLGQAAKKELQESPTYRIQGSKLATIRCDMLDAGQRYCVSVEMGPGVNDQYIVGIDNLFSRKLLQLTDSNSTESSFFRFVVPPEAYERALHADWSSVKSFVCRHVPRLLLEEQPDRVGIPTRDQMSLADGELLRSCVRWRAVGIEIVHISNISDIIPETFLLGPDDFASAIMSHPTRIHALLTRPWIFVRAVLHTSYMAPVRLIIRDVHRWFVHANIEAFASTNALASAISEVLRNETYNLTNQTSEDIYQEFSRGMSIQLGSSLWSHLFRRRTDSMISSPSRTRTRPVRKAVPVTGTPQNEENKHQKILLSSMKHSFLHTHHSRTHWVPEEDRKHVHSYTPQTLQRQIKPNMQLNSAHSRNLKNFIDNSFVARMNAVQRYSSDVALGEGVVQILPAIAAQEFVRGPLPWPPTYVYYGGDGTCYLATSIYEAILKTTRLLQISFDRDKMPPRPTVSYNPIKIFVDSWQRSKTIGLDLQNKTMAYDSLPKKPFMERVMDMQWYVRYPVLLVHMVTNLEEAPFLGIALEIPSIIRSLLRCDVESAMYCTKHKYSVVTAAFIALIMLTILGFVFSSLGIPVVSTLLAILGFSSLTLFIAFGLSPACFPIVPSCFFETIVTDFVYWLPEMATIPQSLLSCQHDQSLNPVPPECIVDCNKTPFYFEYPTANVGWITCRYAPAQCQQLQEYLRTPGNTFTAIAGTEISTALQKALFRSATVIQSGDFNMIDAFGWCNALNVYKLIPLLFAAFVAVGAIPLLIAVIIKSIISLVRTTLAVYVLSHL